MSIEEATKQNIRKVFEKQKANRIKLANTTAKERKTKLKKLLSVIMNSQNEICEAVYKDLRKSKEETKLTEIFTVTTELKHTINKLNSWMRPERTFTPLAFFGASSKIMRESIGQSLIISPWNYPFQLVVGPLISAIAAGNAVIIKPSEKSPHTSEMTRKMIDNLFPEEEVKVFLGDEDVSKELTSLPFNHIFFTGSTEVGKMVIAAGSKHLAKITLELGGKSPTIINHDAAIKISSKRIAWSKFMNAGQTCVAPDYILVHNSIKESFIAELKNSIESIYGKDEGLKKENHYCRIVNKDHLQTVKAALNDSVDKGAKIFYGGEVIEDDNFIQPTLVVDAKMDSKLMTSEIFGPVLPILTFENDADIYRITEMNPNPLALYIYSKNKSFVKKMLSSIPAGSAMVNDSVVHFANRNLPFGGINSSGIGNSHGYYGFKTFSNEKSVMKQSKLSALLLLYPPYNNFKKKLIDIVIKYL